MIANPKPDGMLLYSAREFKTGKFEYEVTVVKTNDLDVAHVTWHSFAISKLLRVSLRESRYEANCQHCVGVCDGGHGGCAFIRGASEEIGR